MMETLLSLPLYLVMLAGLFWLGELCVARLTLTHAERMRLWEQGNRNDHTEKPETEIFGFLAYGTTNRPVLVTGESAFAPSFSADLAANSWGSMISGSATIKTRRSEWSWGIVKSVKNLWSEAANSNVDDGENEVPMKARVDANGNSLSSTVLFRSKYDGGRATSDWSGSTKWNSIYLGKWEDFVVPVVPAGVENAKSLYEYNRNSYYLSWSL